MAIQTDQIVSDDTLKSLGTTSREQVKSIFTRLNSELDAPLRLHATHPVADAKLNFSASSIALGDGAFKSIPALKSQVFTLAASSIDFQTQATTGATFAITWPTSTVGRYRRAGFTLLSSGVIQVLFSAESVSLGSLVNAGTLFVKSGIALGFIDLEATDVSGKFKTAGSATNIIENAKISRFSSGSGGSGSGTSALGSDLVDLLYKVSALELLDNAPDGTTTIDITSGKTDASLHDSSNELFRLNYDASKTVTGTGTAMTLSGAPSFTIKNGDVLIVGSEVRKFTVTNQTTITLESAFSTDPSTTACCISQAVHTVDLNNMTNGGLGLSAASQFSGSIDEALVAYDDTETLGDIIPNYGEAPVIAYSASTDGTSWTTSRVRQTSLESSEAIVSFPTTNASLYLRFFANKTSGTGAVNLLGYEAAFHKRIGSSVGGTYYTAFARPLAGLASNCSIGLVGGKTRLTFNFPYTRGLNSSEPSGSILDVTINGQSIPRRVAGVTDDGQSYFTEINDNTIEFDTNYAVVDIDIQVRVRRMTVVDSNTANTSKIALHDDLLDQTIEAQVVPTFLSAFNGAPSAGQFRSDITNRASIPDLSSMLSVQMGVQRMMTHEIYQIQNEFGPNGQPVFGAVNDKFNQIRYVGSGWNAQNTVNGINIFTSIINDYIEVVFYGTGLNILLVGLDGNRDFRVSVDGGSEGSNLITSSSSQATILQSRNYTPNQIVSVVSGLSLGLHTARIRTNSSIQSGVSGFEILTETTSLRVAPGNIMKGKYKNTLSSLQTIAYDSNFESGTLGTKGGCVLVYLKADGTIGKSVTPTDATPLYLTNTNHTNEELIRTHHWREFGAARTDDFSINPAGGVNANRAFTLDDGVTSLVAQNTGAFALSDGEYLCANLANGFITLTFVGTGLDIIRRDSVNAAGNVNILVDGVSIGTLSDQVALRTTVKICSGLPYGTHTVKFLISATNYNFALSQFLVYAPKKPALPVGSIELAQYYKMADYVVAPNAAIGSIGNGVIRKNQTREIVYFGTWTPTAINVSAFEGGFDIGSNVASSYIDYTFYGTGISFKGYHNINAAANTTVSIDGSANLSAYTTSFSQTGSGLSLNPSTGVISGTTSSANHFRISINGLPLGKHTVRVTQNVTTVTLYSDGFDVICPIHAPTLNGPYVVQNTLSLGNNNFLDLRKFNKRDVPMTYVGKNNFAKWISTATTTSATNIPLVDCSTTYYSEGELVSIEYNANMKNNQVAQAWAVNFAVNGNVLSPGVGGHGIVAGLDHAVSMSKKTFLPKGFHKIDVYWSSSSGSTSTAEQRQLTVTKLGDN